MKKFCAWLVFVLVFTALSSGAKALILNPDGYIGSLTMVLDGSYTPTQSWNTTKDYYRNSHSSAFYDSADQFDAYNRKSGWGLDLMFKYPLSRSMTFGFGGSFDQSFLHTREEYAQWVIPPANSSSTTLSNMWTGVSDYDDNHGIYTMKMHLVYYWGSHAESGN